MATLGKKAIHHNAKGISEHENNNVSEGDTLKKARNKIEIIAQAFGALAIIGGISITILLYYHKQIPAIWATFATMDHHYSLCCKDLPETGVKI